MKKKILIILFTFILFVTNVYAAETIEIIKENSKSLISARVHVKEYEGEEDENLGKTYCTNSEILSAIGASGSEETLNSGKKVQMYQELPYSAERLVSSGCMKVSYNGCSISNSETDCNLVINGETIVEIKKPKLSEEIAVAKVNSSSSAFVNTQTTTLTANSLIDNHVDIKLLASKTTSSTKATIAKVPFYSYTGHYTKTYEDNVFERDYEAYGMSPGLFTGYYYLEDQNFAIGCKDSNTSAECGLVAIITKAKENEDKYNYLSILLALRLYAAYNNMGNFVDGWVGDTTISNDNIYYKTAYLIMQYGYDGTDTSLKEVVKELKNKNDNNVSQDNTGILYKKSSSKDLENAIKLFKEAEEGLEVFTPSVSLSASNKYTWRTDGTMEFVIKTNFKENTTISDLTYSDYRISTVSTSHAACGQYYCYTVKVKTENPNDVNTCASYLKNFTVSFEYRDERDISKDIKKYASTGVGYEWYLVYERDGNYSSNSYNTAELNIEANCCLEGDCCEGDTNLTNKNCPACNVLQQDTSNMTYNCNDSTEGSIEDPQFCSMISNTKSTSEYEINNNSLLSVSDYSNSNYCSVVCREKTNFKFMDKVDAIAGRTFTYDVKDDQNNSKKWTSIVEGELECLSYDIKYEKWYEDYENALKNVVYAHNMWSMYDALSKTPHSTKAGDTAIATQAACCARWSVTCNECEDPEEDCPNGVNCKTNNVNGTAKDFTSVTSETHILKLNSNKEKTAILKTNSDVNTDNEAVPTPNKTTDGFTTGEWYNVFCTGCKEQPDGSWVDKEGNTFIPLNNSEYSTLCEGYLGGNQRCITTEKKKYEYSCNEPVPDAGCDCGQSSSCIDFHAACSASATAEIWSWQTTYTCFIGSEFKKGTCYSKTYESAGSASCSNGGSCCGSCPTCSTSAPEDLSGSFKKYAEQWKNKYKEYYEKLENLIAKIEECNLLSYESIAELDDYTFKNFKLANVSSKNTRANYVVSTYGLNADDMQMSIVYDDKYGLKSNFSNIESYTENLGHNKNLYYRKNSAIETTYHSLCTSCSSDMTDNMTEEMSTAQIPFFYCDNDIFDGTCNTIQITVPNNHVAMMSTSRKVYFYQAQKYKTNLLTGLVSKLEDGSLSNNITLEEFAYPLDLEKSNGLYEVSVSFGNLRSTSGLLNRKNYKTVGQYAVDETKYTCYIDVCNETTMYEGTCKKDEDVSTKTCCDEGENCIEPNPTVASNKTYGFFYRTVDLNDLFTSNRLYGSNFCNDSNIAKVKEIEQVGDSVFTTASITPEYKVVLTPSNIKQIKKYNLASNNLYDDNTLKCEGLESSFSCKSTFIDTIYGQNGSSIYASEVEIQGRNKFNQSNNNSFYVLGN